MTTADKLREMLTRAAPGTLTVREDGEPNQYTIMHTKPDGTKEWIMTLLHNGSSWSEEQVANMELFVELRNATPALLDVLHWAEAVSICPAHEHVVLLRKALDKLDAPKEGVAWEASWWIA